MNKNAFVVSMLLTLLCPILAAAITCDRAFSSRPIVNVNHRVRLTKNLLMKIQDLARQESFENHQVIDVLSEIISPGVFTGFSEQTVAKIKAEMGSANTEKEGAQFSLEYSGFGPTTRLLSFRLFDIPNYRIHKLTWDGEVRVLRVMVESWIPAKLFGLKKTFSELTLSFDQSYRLSFVRIAKSKRLHPVSWDVAAFNVDVDGEYFKPIGETAH